MKAGRTTALVLTSDLVVFGGFVRGCGAWLGDCHTKQSRLKKDRKQIVICSYSFTNIESQLHRPRS
jgi:hypothetical protein